MLEDFSDLGASASFHQLRASVRQQREGCEQDERVIGVEQMEVMAVFGARGSEKRDSLDNQSTLALSLDIQVVSLTQEFYIFL